MPVGHACRSESRKPGSEPSFNECAPPVKQVRVQELVNSKEERDRLFAEIRVLKQLKHKNIMSFHDSWLDQKTMCVNFITELFTSGTLRQCVPSSPCQPCMRLPARISSAAAYPLSLEV